MNNKTNYFISLILVFFSFGYFVFGFIVGENSAGAGGYNGDFLHVWPNLQIYLNNDLKAAITSQDFYSNRSPLAYIIHKYLNPLTNNQFNYRLSVFFISLLIPLLLFLCLRLRYKKVNILLLSVVTSVVLFSPYVRTSGYWALEENYGIVSILATYIFYNLFLYKKKNKNINLFFLIFFSSCCIYFDLKLALIPLIIFISILFSNEKKIHKLYMIFLYFLFSIPYLFLIYVWGNIFSPQSQKIHTLESGLYLDHLVYVVPMLGLYIFPFFFFIKKKFFLLELKKQLLKKFNIIATALFLLILIYIQFFYKIIILDYGTNMGRGFIYKLGNLMFEDQLYQKIFFIISSLISFVIVLLYLKKNLNNWLIIFYFLILSLVTYPLLQEYFDPLILLMLLLFFKIDINFEYKPAYLLYAYFLTMNLFANYYYYDVLKIHQ